MGHTSPVWELPTLHGPRLTLRTPRESDIADRQRAGRNAEFTRMCGGSLAADQPMTLEEARGWLAHVTSEPTSWAIECDGQCIGHVCLHHLVPMDRRASLGIGIFDAARWSQGYGTEAIELVLAEAFGPLGLHRVALRVLASNPRAIACYEKCGFRREGVERETCEIDDVWHDDLMMGLLEDEWHPSHPRLCGKKGQE